MTSTETLFTSLPFKLQFTIDDVFNELADSIDSTITSAGFIPESPQISGGGFIAEDGPKVTHIKLSAIPEALKRLKLPQDEEVLSVFRNAASGWSSSQSQAIEQKVGEGLVSREDWRSVCAVLLENEEGDFDNASMDDPMEASDNDDDAESGEEYSDSHASNEDEEDEDEDEYTEGFVRKGRKGTRRQESSRSPSPENQALNRKLTKRERQDALDAFTLFFPSIPAEQVKDQKIMLKDIQRVAGLLGEKIKAEEMVDMLEAFSTSPDKSINLEDFGRIMVAANLL